MLALCFNGGLNHLQIYIIIIVPWTVVVLYLAFKKCMFWHILGAQLPTCALTSVFRPYHSQQYDVVLPPLGGGFVNIKKSLKGLFQIYHTRQKLNVGT